MQNRGIYTEFFYALFDRHAPQFLFVFGLSIINFVQIQTSESVASKSSLAGNQ